MPNKTSPFNPFDYMDTQMGLMIFYVTMLDPLNKQLACI